MYNNIQVIFDKNKASTNAFNQIKIGYSETLKIYINKTLRIIVIIL